MGLLSKVSLESLVSIQNAISEQAKKSRSLESAAQEYMSNLERNFSESITFFSTVIFLSETIEKSLAERFMLQANKFKTAIQLLIEEGKIFAH